MKHSFNRNIRSVVTEKHARTHTHTHSLMSFFQSEKKYLDFLLETTNPKQRKALIKCATPGQLKAFGEAALNILNLIVPLNDAQRVIFKKNKNVLIKFAHKKISAKKAEKFSLLVVAMIEAVRENYEEN